VVSVSTQPPATAREQQTEAGKCFNDPWAGSLKRQLIPQLRTQMESKLPAYMVVASIALLERLPLTPNGKIDRRALPAPASVLQWDEVSEPPEGEIEEKLAELWCELLHVEHIGRDSDFFELGGHSLAGLRLIASLSSVFSIPPVMGSIFNYSTVRKMAELVQREITDRSTRSSRGERVLQTGVI
jgi:microcystin synthetase protein McyA